MTRRTIKVDSWAKCMQKSKEAIDMGGSVRIHEVQGMYTLTIIDARDTTVKDKELADMYWAVIKESFVFDAETTQGEATVDVQRYVESKLDPRYRRSNQEFKRLLISKGLVFSQGRAFRADKKTSIIRGLKFKNNGTL